MTNHPRIHTLNRLRSLTHLLDNAIAIPGTSYRIGLDPLLGLFPGAGDYIGAALSAYIVLKAAQMGIPKAILTQMVTNILIETLVGSVPILGDLFDAAWKANAKNMALLETHVNRTIPQENEEPNWLFVTLLLGILMLVVIAITAVGIILIRLLLR